MTIRRLDWSTKLSSDSATIRIAAGGSTETLAVDLSGEDYWFVTNTESTGSIIEAVATAIESHTQISTCTGSYSFTTFKARFVCNTDFQFVWTDGLASLPPDLIGYDGITNSSTGSTLVSPDGSRGVWRPGRPPREDSRDRNNMVGGTRSTVIGSTRTAHFGITTAERDLFWHLLPKEKALQEYADSGNPDGAFESAWLRSVGKGWPFRLFDAEDSASKSGVGDYVIRSLNNPMDRDGQFGNRWTVTLAARSVI